MGTRYMETHYRCGYYFTMILFIRVTCVRSREYIAKSPWIHPVQKGLYSYTYMAPQQCFLYTNTIEAEF